MSRDVQRYLTETAKFFEECDFKISINKTVAILFSRSKQIQTNEVILKINDENQVREDGEVLRRHLRPGSHMSNTHRHHRPMQSPAEHHARDSWINFGSIQKHPVYHLQGCHQVRLRLRMHGPRQSGSEDEGDAGSASRTGSENLLRIVTWNSQSVTASGMRPTSAQPSRSTSAVRLRCQDPE